MESIGIDVDSTNFDQIVLDQGSPSVVWVWASWCHNCKSMKPFLEKAVLENKHHASFFNLKADNNRELAKKYKVLGVPSLLFFNHGVLLKRKVGILNDREIKKNLDPLLTVSAEEAKSNELTGYFRWPFKKKKPIT